MIEEPNENPDAPIENPDAPDDTAAHAEVASPPVSPQRQPKRKLVLSLLVLYAVAILAAVVVLLRAPAKDGVEVKNGEASTGLLSLASGKKDAVGYVVINGPIYGSPSGGMFDRGTRQWARKIRRLGAKKEVKAIVLAINSPGGSVGAVQEVYAQILRTKKETKKPIVAHLGDIAASGGYYLAAPCDSIVSHPGTLLGSIGVIFHNTNLEGLFSKIGMKSNVIKSGKMKDIGSMSRPMTAEERKLMQALIDNAYGQFFRAVADGREMSEGQLRKMADGRIFTGEQGIENGLVDRLGDTRDAIGVAAKLGGIKDKNPRVIKDGDSLSSVLELLESRLTILFSPNVALYKEAQYLNYKGLEYRWR